MHGLVALMEIQASRATGAIGPDGEPVLLLDQDRARWDPLLMRRGLAALERAEELGRGARPVHAAGGDRRLPRAGARAPRRPTGRGSRRSTRPRPAHPVPVVELNRAVAVGMAFGPGAGLELVDALVAAGELDGYHLLA